MSRDNRLARVKALIESEQTPFPEAANVMAGAIRDRHGACVRGFLFYGSARREGEQAGKMLDFYVIVDRYRSVHGRGLKQLASFLIPPSVHYMETASPGGEVLRSKYAIISEKALIRRASGGAFESMLWARFAQPTLVDATTPSLHNALIDTLSHACIRLATETLPLIKAPADLEGIWARGLCESYRTELRPENAQTRTAELVARFSQRYAELTNAIFGADNESRQAALDAISGWQRFSCRARWAIRRVTGKIMAALRVIKAAFTFDAGLDYVLEKIEGHSGARIEVTERERKHPVIMSPVLAWKILRARVLR